MATADLQAATTTGADWVADLLKALGAPNSADNRTAMAAWAQSEGVSPSWNNWLAITDPAARWPHAGVVAANGGNPVYGFPSEPVGVAATASFLQAANYHDVVAAFQQDAGLPTIWASINKSPWCAGCQAGKYPNVLYQAQQGKGAPVSLISTTGGTASSASSSSGSTGSLLGDLDTFVKGLLDGSFVVRGLEILAGAILFAGGGILIAVAVSRSTGAAEPVAEGFRTLRKPIRATRPARATTRKQALGPRPAQRRSGVSQSERDAIRRRASSETDTEIGGLRTASRARTARQDREAQARRREEDEEEAYYEGAAERAKETAKRAPRTSAGGRRQLGTLREADDF